MAATLKAMILDLEAVGLTQQQIEVGTGIAQSSISKIKNGQQWSVFHEKADALRRLHTELTQQKTPSVA